MGTDVKLLKQDAQIGETLNLYLTTGETIKGKIIELDDFEKNLESAWVSDGEYYYYPVTKFNENWIRKQPFEYIMRGN